MRESSIIFIYMAVVEIRPIKIEEYQALRGSTSWNQLADDVVAKSLANDLFSVCVMDGDKTVGIGRVVGDGAIYFYIQDVIVLPEYQGKGIGRQIMHAIENYLSEATSHNSFIGLMAAEDTQPFYHLFDYRERPGNAPGMFKRIRKQ